MWLIEAFMLPFGRFCAIFNVKWFYIISVLIFEGGSALCGAAPNMNALIVGRMIAGLGATGITSELFILTLQVSTQARYS